MRRSFGRVALVIGLAAILSGQASVTGVSLKERVDLADFIGVVHVDAVHPTPDASLPMDKRKDWYLQVAEATVVNTIKGHEVPQHLKIKFDNGQPDTHPLYRSETDYLVFLAIEFEDGVFSTAERGQYAIDSSKVIGWSGAAEPVPLEVVQEEIDKLVPAAWKSSSRSSGATPS